MNKTNKKSQKVFRQSFLSINWKTKERDDNIQGKIVFDDNHQRKKCDPFCDEPVPGIQSFLPDFF